MMQTEYDSYTLYMPLSDRMGVGHRYSEILNPDMVYWLNENTGGIGVYNWYQWIAELDNDSYGWCYRGKDHSPESHMTAACRVFCFKNPVHATLFKLTWGGA
jgi:hypothetical protein